MLGMITAPLILFRRPATDWRPRLLALAAAAAGLEGFLANVEPKMVDLPLILIACAVYVSTRFSGGVPAGAAVRTWEPYLTVLATLLLFAGPAAGATRLRVLMILYGEFYEYRLTDQPFQNAFFRNLRTGARFHAVVDEVGEALRRHPGARVFFGPRMEWAYAAFALPAAIGQPIWWEPGISFRPEDQTMYMKRWAADKFDVLIFSRNDRTFFSDEFQAMIQANYIPEEGYATVDVLRLKPAE